MAAGRKFPRTLFRGLPGDLGVGQIDTENVIRLDAAEGRQTSRPSRYFSSRRDNARASPRLRRQTNILSSTSTERPFRREHACLTNMTTGRRAMLRMVKVFCKDETGRTKRTGECPAGQTSRDFVCNERRRRTSVVLEAGTGPLAEMTRFVGGKHDEAPETHDGLADSGRRIDNLYAVRMQERGRRHTSRRRRDANVPNRNARTEHVVGCAEEAPFL